jgi:chromosome segregation ATPase
MDDASEVIYRLNPVAFRYKKEIDRSQSPDYGLVAEDVADVDPNLTIRGKDGQIENVRYRAIDAMLLNEFLKQHNVLQEQGREIQARKNRIVELKATIEQQEATISRQRRTFQSKLTEQENQIEALAAALEKTRARLEVSNRASRVVANER